MAKIVLIDLDVDIIVILFRLFEIFNFDMGHIMLLEINSYYFVR